MSSSPDLKRRRHDGEQERGSENKGDDKEGGDDRAYPSKSTEVTDQTWAGANTHQLG